MTRIRFRVLTALLTVAVMLVAAVPASADSGRRGAVAPVKAAPTLLLLSGDDGGIVGP